MPDKEKLRDNLWGILFFILILALAIVILILIVSVRKEDEIDTVVGGIFIGSVEDRGWNQNHYEGLRDACEELKLPLEIVEHVSENEKECMAAVQKLYDKGAKIIFLTSAGFGDNIIEVNETFPDVMFFTVSPESTADNMTTYFGRIYQMRYLTGIVAGDMTKTDNLGFVGAMRDPQVYRNINAYYLGIKSVNPDAHLKVIFIDSWGDTTKERQAAERLIKQEGVDVLSYHNSHPTTVEVAEENDVYSIGYSGVSGLYSDKFLTAALFHWGVLYQSIIQDYLRGSISDEYWRGASEGVVGLGDFSPLVPSHTKKAVNRASAAFGDGQDVFMGKLKDTDGQVRCYEHERIGDKSLFFDMNWLLEGVEEIAD